VPVGVGVSVDVPVGVGVGVEVLVGVGVDVDVPVGVGVDVDVPVGVGMGVRGVEVALGEGVGPVAASLGVGVPIGVEPTTIVGTMTAVPTGVRIRFRSQGVSASSLSGSTYTFGVSRTSSGFSPESILAETDHLRVGLTAICAVTRRQADPSSSISRNTSRSRRSWSLLLLL